MKQNHIHKYLRINHGRDRPYWIYKCVDNCSHFIAEHLILGREAICWKCNDSFTITRLKKRKPICQTCWNVTYGKTDNAEEILKGIGVI